MSLKLKSASFKKNELKTNEHAVSVVWLDPDTGSDPFATGLCVLVKETNPPTRVWGGMVQTVPNGRAMARLKINGPPCDNVQEATDPDDDGEPRGTEDETTDVSVTISNPNTSTDESTVDTKGVKVLP